MACRFLHEKYRGRFSVPITERDFNRAHTEFTRRATPPSDTYARSLCSRKMHAVLLADSKERERKRSEHYALVRNIAEVLKSSLKWWFNGIRYYETDRFRVASFFFFLSFFSFIVYRKIGRFDGEVSRNCRDFASKWLPFFLLLDLLLFQFQSSNVFFEAKCLPSIPRRFCFYLLHDCKTLFVTVSWS